MLKKYTKYAATALAVASLSTFMIGCGETTDETPPTEIKDPAVPADGKDPAIPDGASPGGEVPPSKSP
jgi:hypothetical protein